MRHYHDNTFVTSLLEDTIFVFGSNLAGRHGAGAARKALNSFGAVWGYGLGFQGQSYAIPTKDENIQTLTLSHINCYVQGFINFADCSSDLKFFVTEVGCGLAGYTVADIAPMFENAPSNCILPISFKPYVEN